MDENGREQLKRKSVVVHRHGMILLMATERDRHPENKMINQSHLFRRRISFNLLKEMRKPLHSLSRGSVGGWLTIQKEEDE